jgi:hypothetical protein
MNTPIEDAQWIYVVVQDPGGNPRLLGQHDTKSGDSFIPAFLEKDAAKSCLPLMAKESGQTYEVEAMMFETVREDAGKNGFAVFILDQTGAVIEKVPPSA